MQKLGVFPIRVSGIVVKGRGEGRKLGFPTANIVLENPLPSGVYAGTALNYGKSYKAGIFVHDSKLLLEAHLIGFSGDLYGKRLDLEIICKMRDSVPYTTNEDMMGRIAADMEWIMHH